MLQRVLFRYQSCPVKPAKRFREIASGEWAHSSWLARNSNEAQERIRGLEEAAGSGSEDGVEQGPVKVHADSNFRI